MAAEITPDLPPSLRELWNRSGPVLRFRILRDLAGQDESYIETARRGIDLQKDPAVLPVLAAQMASGLWGDFLTTEVAVLHLCELGLERSGAIERTRDKVLVPTLTRPDALWELEKLELDDDGRKLARRIVRDKSLRMLCRSSREDDAALRPFLEQVLVEWDHWLNVGHPLPTADGYAAVCHYPWDDDEFERIRDIVSRLERQLETPDANTTAAPDLLAPHLLRLPDKWQYLAQPTRLFHDLELAATLGVARDLSSTSWMLEELEARQDADGFFRFPDADAVEPSWYFPIEEQDPDQYFVEYTFRAELIFKLLSYDV